MERILIGFVNILAEIFEFLQKLGKQMFL